LSDALYAKANVAAAIIPTIGKPNMGAYASNNAAVGTPNTVTFSDFPQYGQVMIEGVIYD